MHDIIVYVDTDRLPEYVAGELSIGLTLAPVLDRPKKDVTLPELWNDSRTLARPWAWEPLKFVLIEVQDGAATVKHIVERFVPDPNAAVARWMDVRADRYWAHTHSWQLALLVDLEWPDTRDALPPLMRAIHRLDLRRHRRTLERLREQVALGVQEKEQARRVFVDVLQRLIDDSLLAAVVDELKALRDTDAGGFAAAARAAVTRLAGTSVGDNATKLRDCAYFRFGRGTNGAAASDEKARETERTSLGFLANLTGAMAPVPQTAQLSHVIQIPLDDVDTGKAIVLVPLIALTANGQPHVLTRDDVVAAVGAAAAAGQPLVSQEIFTLSMQMSNGGPMVRVHGSLLRDPAEPAANPVHDRLWARSISLVQGLVARHIRDDIREGLDLFGPLVAAMETFALVPDVAGAIRLALSALYNRTMPGPMVTGDRLRRASALRRILVELRLTDDDIQTIGKSWKELGFSEFRRIVESRMPEISAMSGPRTIHAEVTDGSRQVRLVQDIEELILHVDVSPTPEATYDLSIWSSEIGDMEKRLTGLTPIAGGSTLALSIRGVLADRRGLKVGRYRLSRTDPTGKVHTDAQFTLGVDEKSLASIRVLDAVFAGADAHARLVIELLGNVVNALPRATQERLPEIVPRLANRAAILADRMHEGILDVLCAPDPETRFASVEKTIWDEITRRADVGTPPLEEAIQGHAEKFLKEAIAARTGLSVTPLPFEISLTSRLPDNDDYDDDGKPDVVDPLVKLAGVGVLMRRKGLTWCCLNAAALEIGGGAKPVSNVVGLPIGYHEGVASAVVTYDGLPVAIRSPMTDEDAHVLAQANPGEEMQERAPAEYRLIDLEEAPSWARAPRLVYGEEYEVSGFFVHQCGALPPEIASRTAPWLLAEPAGLPAHAPLQKEEYRRTTPIAAPRLQRTLDPGSARVRGDLGTRIPADVYPLARDLPRMSVIGDGPARRLFVSGNRGTLDLSGGAWTLLLEGIEARGFDANGYTLRVDLRAKDNAIVHPKDVVPAIELRRTGNELSIKILTQGLSFDFPPMKLAGPVSIRLRLSAPGLAGSYRASLEVWPTDGPVLAAAHEVAEAALGALFKSKTCLEISATGSPEAGGLASVAFHVPRVDTDASARATAPLDEAPVVLMAPGDDSKRYDLKALVSELELRLRAPAVDVDAWERAFLVKSGQDGHAKLVEHLANVRAGWQIGLERNAEAEAAQAAPPIDLGLDDPHVTHLLVAAVPLHARSKHRAVLAGPVELKCILDEKPYQIKPGPLDDTVIRRLLDVGTRAEVVRKIVHNDNAMLQQLAPGETWELLVWPLVPSAVRGLSDSVRSLLVPWRFKDIDWLVGPAKCVILESATDALPSFEAMRAALTTAVIGRHIRVTLEPGALPVSPAVDAHWGWRRHAFAYLHDATVERQRWRWNGRPMRDYPFEAMAKLPRPDLAPYEAGQYEAYKEAEVVRLAAVLEWEVEGFGDRDQADYLMTSHVIRPFAVTDLRDEDLTGDDRAQHWRFRIKARSRYAGVLRGGAVEVSLPLPPMGEQKVSIHDPWCRALVLAVPPPKIKPPAVRVVLPLTLGGSDDPDSTPPPLLVVLDDPWFDIGGLSERFVAEVEERPFKRAPDPVLVRQVGVDPIRAGRDDVLEIEFTTSGPIGYTYDQGASAQRFAHSSFLLAADGRTELPDWSFVKLRFRREFVPAGVAAGAPADALKSPNTPGLWCQFAADFARFDSSFGTIRADELLVERQENAVFRRRVDGKPVQLWSYGKPDGDARLTVALWLVVTEQITDAARRRTEHYVSTHALTTEGEVQRLQHIHGTKTATPGPLIGRVVEVESRGALANPSLDALWPTVTEESPWDATAAADAKARIVKVSPPIPVRGTLP